MIRLAGKKIKGFTLPELLAVMFTFSLLSMSVFGTLILGMRYLRRSEDSIQAQQSCRYILDTISSELRQAIINPDPGTFSDPNGYYGVTPPIDPTAVLFPHEHTQQGDYVTFNGVNPELFDPSDEDFDWYQAQYYTQVRYYVENGNQLIREVKTYDNQGNTDEILTDPVAECLNGSIVLQITSIDSFRVKVQVTCTQNSESYTGSVTVFLRSE